VSRRSPRTEHEWAKHPTLLTNISSVADLLLKLDWNLERFQQEVERRPCDSEGVAYAAIDYCVTSVALRDWFLDLQVVDPATQLPWSHETLRSRVEWLAACENIANTAKHGSYRDDNWSNGIAPLQVRVPDHLVAERDACADGLELFGFIHRYREQAWWDIFLHKAKQDEGTDGWFAFGKNFDDWQQLLRSLKLEDD
jgi:hypothetical protein